jgi:hypothetical protein
MSLSDYIPNIISAPTGYEGLLGAEPTRKLEKQANLQGLLGVAASLAQGMSSQGPRRSALQNILGSLAGGFGATQQAYQGGLQQYGQQQQIAQANIAAEQAKNLRDAVARVKLMPEVANDPALMAALDADPTGTLKLINEEMPIRRAYGQRATAPIPAVAVSAPAPISPYEQAKALTGEASTQAPQQVPAPVDKPPTLPEITSVSKTADLQNRKNRLMEVNSRLDEFTSERSLKAKKSNSEEIANIDKQLAQEVTANIDFAGAKRNVHPDLLQELNNIEYLAGSGQMDIKDVQASLRDIFKSSREQVNKEQDYTNEFTRVAKSLFPTKSFKELQGPELGQVQARLQAEAERRAKFSASNINVGDKTLVVERMKQQATAEEAASNAQNAASDIRAIVDILKPYQGGAFDEYRSKVGAFLPGTSLAQLSTANDAANAIRAKLAPLLRVPGSGETSNFEAKQFLSALPSLMNYPEGRELGAVYAQRFADRATAAADIKYKMIQDGSYSPKAFQDELKAAGFDRILTADDIAILQGKKKVGFVPSKELDDAVKKYQKK